MDILADLPDAPNIVWPKLIADDKLLSTQLKTTDPVQIAENGYTERGHLYAFTEKAKEVLYTLGHLGYKVYHACEELKHDGYDEMGPESDLWYLSVFTYNSVYEPVQHIFTWENWHGPFDKECSYYLIETRTKTDEECWWNLNYNNILDAMK
jgi:hypothetical protein